MPVLQAKLEVGPPNDRFEKEADRVADQVMRMADPQRPGAINPVGEAPDGVQRMCADCEEEVRRQPAEDEEEGLHMKRVSGAMPEIAPGLQTQISGLRGRGQPLTAALRGFFEPRFGHDFSQVHLHQGSQASAAARALGARAYTLGQDVVFGAGEYAPDTRRGRYLLAHELTHVVQQTGTAHDAAASTPSKSHVRVARKGPHPLVRALGRWVEVKTVLGPRFKPCGQTPLFEWHVNFDSSLQQSENTGYIVQRIDTTFNAHNCDGTPFAGDVPTPLYWERWYIEQGKMVTKKDATFSADDNWTVNLCNPRRPQISGCDPYPKDTYGDWSTTGTIYIFPGTDLQGFSSNRTSMSPAGGLEYTLKDPGDVLGRPREIRSIGGKWDCCPIGPSHPKNFNEQS